MDKEWVTRLERETQAGSLEMRLPAEELPGELTRRQVQAELEGEDTAQAGGALSSRGVRMPV